jgi:hypothetical protein
MWADSDQVGDMRNLTARRGSIAGVAVVAVMALTLGACGGESSPKSSPSSPTSQAPETNTSGSQIVLASVQTTAAAKSARESMTISTKGSGPAAFSLTAEGAIDFETGDSQFTADLGGAASAFLSGGLEVRVVDGTTYMKLPAALGHLFGGTGGGEKWISLKLPKSAQGAAGSSPFSGLGASDPTQFLSALERVSDDVKEVGTETVRGVETKHYAATLDLKKAIDNAKLPESLRVKAGDLFGKVGDLPPIPVDVFIDSDGHLRRLQIDMDLGAFAGLAGGPSGATGATGSLPTLSVSLDLYDFGKPVHVDAPAADQIISLKDFGMNGGGAFGFGSPTAAPSTKVS